MRTIGSMIGRTRAGLALMLVLLLAGLVTIGAPTNIAAADVMVTINGFAFMPATMTVPVGTRVVWMNQQPGVPHTVTSDTGVWDSGTLGTGATFAFTFNQPGTFPYHCNIHPNMHGTITVTAVAAATPTAPTTQGQPTIAPPPTVRPPAAAAAPATAAPPRPAPTIPAAMPRTGGGAAATRVIGDDTRTPWLLWIGIAALVGLAGTGATVYARSRR